MIARDKSVFSCLRMFGNMPNQIVLNAVHDINNQDSVFAAIAEPECRKWTRRTPFICNNLSIQYTYEQPAYLT